MQSIPYVTCINTLAQVRNRQKETDGLGITLGSAGRLG